jgi:hypothetical protein
MTIELLGGLHINTAALATALALEWRGHTLSVVDGQLVVSNASRLTVHDREDIKRHRLALMTIAAYKAP